MESRVAEQKKQLRGELLRLRRETPRQQKQVIDRQICQHVINSPEYRQAQTIFAYWSTDEEIDTHAILADARQRGKRVCVPKCLKGHRMIARQICSEADLTEQTFGIPEPGEQCPEIAPEEIDLCLVPALACDASGIRLGYGGGFYDRYLADREALRLRSIAVGFRCQQVESVPVEETDVKPYQVILV